MTFAFACLSTARLGAPADQYTGDKKLQTLALAFLPTHKLDAGDSRANVSHHGGIGILLKGAWGNILWTALTALLGLNALAAGLTGWLLRSTNYLERALLIGAGLILVDPGLTQDAIGLGLFAIAFLMQYRRRLSGR